MLAATIILAVMAVVASVVSVFALLQSRKAATLSTTANRLSKEANDVAEQARRDAVAAPAEAERRQVYSQIREHFTTLYQALNDAWAYDNSRSLGQPPANFLDAIAHARKLGDDLPKDHLSTPITQGLGAFERLHKSWQQKGTAEDNHARLEAEVRSENTNGPSFARESLAEARGILRDRSREVQEDKDFVDSAMDTLKPQLRSRVYKED